MNESIPQAPLITPIITMAVPQPFDSFVHIAGSESNSLAGIDPAAADNASDRTFMLSGTPEGARPTPRPYRPQVIATVGHRPTCLVNASITHAGKDQIYAFGGFDQYTDEVYNHVFRLDVKSNKWILVPNYGDIPGVRMGTSVGENDLPPLTTDRPYGQSMAREQAAGLRR